MKRSVAWFVAWLTGGVSLQFYQDGSGGIGFLIIVIGFVLHYLIIGKE